MKGVTPGGARLRVTGTLRPALPPVHTLSCLPRPSPTTSSLQTTTKARSLTGSPPACPLLGEPGPATTFAHTSVPNSSANKCLLKVAGYAAQLEQYQKAIDIYEQVGTGTGPCHLLRSATPVSCSYLSSSLPPTVSVCLPLWPSPSTHPG